ncbi:uncharacterized protein hhla1 [Denticeps clupeoides]|uniref:uncharacterized protein hhla1 n=1 Tax=Denticeps clupeoides TaxID=299321 RepID=UPI0010A2DDDF|nr:HERV-H LTR-associating protein 1 [Denticeps clupeoides]
MHAEMADLNGWNPKLMLQFRISAALVTMVLLYTIALQSNQRLQADKRELLAATGTPAEYIDPASIDLTPLVNMLINSTHMGSQHLFSLLSVTSHSSLALQKLTLLLYNISGFKNFVGAEFPTRYCYCVTNHTNDLTDFTAILLDVMGNSSTQLQELFKSSSILSVSQKNSSDCIYICVMAGKTDKDISEMWQLDSITPLFNQTIMEGSHHKSNLTTMLTAIPTQITQASTKPPHREKPGCPWKSELNLRAEPQEDLKETTLSEGKLQPCVFELCKFYSQCLCRTFTSTKFCVESQSWYEKHTEEICTRVQRFKFSRSLKQRCLARMCVRR